MTHDQPTATLTQGRVHIRQSLKQKLSTRRAGGGACQDGGIEDKHRDNLLSIGSGLRQRLVIVQTERTAEPVKSDFVRLFQEAIVPILI